MDDLPRVVVERSLRRLGRRSWRDRLHAMRALYVRGLLALLIASVAQTASADILVFKNGERMRGTIVKRTATEVVVELDMGTMSFKPDEIVSVEDDPQDEDAGEAAEAPSVEQVAAPVPRTGREAMSGTPRPDAGMVPRQRVLPEVMQATVFIGTEYEDGSRQMSSGVVVSPKGLVVTTYRFVNGATRIEVAVPNKRGSTSMDDTTFHTARVLKTDACFDLAILRVPVKTPAYLTFADPSRIQVGEPARPFGNPAGIAQSVSRSVVTGVRSLQEMGIAVGEIAIPACQHISSRLLSRFTLIQTNANVTPWNDGGPLVNGRLEIIGINADIFSSMEGVGFAVHLQHVEKLLGSYAKEFQVPRQ